MTEAKSKNQPIADFSSLGISKKTLEEFFGNLSAMLFSGLNITESLEIIKEQSAGKFKIILDSIGQSISSGRSFSSAMSFYPRIFSDFMINTVKAGEASGNLDSSLDNIAKQMRKESALVSSIRQAMFYPLIVLCLSFIMSLVLSFWVLPKITPIFTLLKVDLPITTRMLIWFSKQIKGNSAFILFGIFLVIILLIWLFRQKWIKPFTHYLYLNIPLIGTITIAKNIAQTTRILGTMLKSGVGIDEALRITEASVSNYYYRRYLSEVYQRVKKGTNLSDALEDAPKYFPKLMVSLIRIGEKTGKLEDKFFHLADIYERRVDASSKMISVAIEPILLVLIGLVVGGLAISIISPIYQVTGNIYR